MFVQETHKREGSEAVPIAAQLALLSRPYLEQGIFLANIIVLMHNHHNLQRGRWHMYSQNGLGQQTNQKITQQWLASHQVQFSEIYKLQNFHVL